MHRYGNRRRHSRKMPERSLLAALVEKIWGPPAEICPKCKSERTEYYDPFFFAPMRTILGKRRIKCADCGFIWRPSRPSRPLLTDFRP